MSRQTIASIFSFVAALCFVSIAFDIMPDNIALFLGIACSMAAGLTWTIGRRER